MTDANPLSYVQWRQTWLDSNEDSLRKAATILSRSIAQNGTIYSVGCGGSYAQAAHFTGELIGGMLTKNGREIRGITLGAEVAALTATANDLGWEHAFARGLRGAEAKDALVVLTTSGTSPVVLKALYAAQIIGMRVVTITGAAGVSAVLNEDDVQIKIALTTTPQVQELTLVLLHELATLLERL